METSKASIRPPPMTLHDIVVDYVVNSGYAGTAKVLAAGPARLPSTTSSVSATPSPEERIEVDGDGEAENGADTSTLTVPAQVSNAKSASPAPSPALDDAVLASIDQRRAILDYILNGAIQRAVDALQTHFPSVLTPAPAGTSNGASRGASSNGAGSESNGASASSSGSYVLNAGQPRPSDRPRTGASTGDATGTGTPTALDHRTPVFARSADPDHVRLNLQIQGFIELYRNLSPSAPPSPSSSMGSLAGSMNGSAQLTSTLSALHNLHTEANRLRPDDRAVYLQEIKDVGGLLAYIEPETSVVSGFLDQQRRIALAQQINAAILKSEGRPVQSHLEQIVRRTHAIYATLHEHGIPTAPSWTGDAKGAGHWRIAEQLKRRPFHEGGFNLREYVWETS